MNNLWCCPPVKKIFTQWIIDLSLSKQKWKESGKMKNNATHFWENTTLSSVMSYSHT